MSLFNEIAGSFIRMGNFPLEANYIFPNEAALKAFFEEDLNKHTLHKGLLKIVEDNGYGNLALYWVIDINGELLFVPLISDINVEDIYGQLDELILKLNQEIQDRKDAITKLYGTEDISDIQEDLNNIIKLSEAITDLRDRTSTLKEQLQATVGTEDEDIISYLQTLDYKSLTEVSNALNHFLNTIDEEDTSISTLPELKDFLRGFEYTHNLYECFVDFWNAILGDPTPNTLFRTLRGILDFIETLASVVKNRYDNLQTELDLTQVGVGLSGDGSFSPDLETYHLKNATSIMNALKILDSLINQAINNVNLKAGETNTARINIVKESDKTTIYADVKLSSEVGNDVVEKTNGLFHRIDTEYTDGILTVRVNGEIRQLHILGLSMIVDSAEYDPSLEAIIIIFKLQSGDTQRVVIPAGALISEWEVDNSQSDKTVELTKVRVIAGGADKLSADVRLSTNKYNILKKDGNSLLVDGHASNIILDGDVTVEGKLNEFSDKILKNDQEILINSQAIHLEEDRATKEEHRLEDLITTQILTIDNLKESISEVKVDIDDMKESVRYTELTVFNMNLTVREINDKMTKMLTWYESN